MQYTLERQAKKDKAPKVDKTPEALKPGREGGREGGRVVSSDEEFFL